MAATHVNSADCLQHEDCARLDDKENDFKVVTLMQSNTLSADFKHACHGMIYARSQTVLWDRYQSRGFVLMQMRFDGVLGFPGGMVDGGEEPVVGLNREMQEEIGLEISKHGFTTDDHVQTVVNEKKKLVLHFFTKEVLEEEFCALEKKCVDAEEYGIEVLGIVRVPLYTMEDGVRGFPAFLANRFIGNSRKQLLMGLEHSKLLTPEELCVADNSSRCIAQNQA